MCSFETPQIIFYVYIPILIASLFLGFFIFFSNKKSQVNINLFILILFFCFWLIVTLLQWLTFNIKINLFLSRISTLETLSLIFLLYFAYSFIGIKISTKNKILISLPFLPVVLLIFTKYNFYSFGDKCDNVQGPLFIYIYALTVVYLTWTIGVLIKFYKKQTIDYKLKKQTETLIKAILFIILWFLTLLPISNYFAKTSMGDYISQFIPIGLIIFIGMLTYIIMEYHFLNTKLFKAQALTYALWLVVGSMYFFAGSIMAKLLVALSVLLTVWFGIMLIRSVRLEIQHKEALEVANKEISERKDELQKMADSLAVANEKLSLANQQLKQLDKIKDDFISFASHQLRTPITGVMGYSSLLAEGSYGKLDSKQQDAMEKIRTAAERMSKLVEDFLNVSKIESGGMKYELGRHKIEDICQEAIAALVPKAGDKDLYLKYEKPKTDLPELLIDGPKIKETISNLIDNAIKYTQKGGVTVRLELAENQQIKTGDKKVVKVTVSDTGIGIPKDELPRLFAKFSRGKDTKRLHAAGTGLGLYVGKIIVESQGGRVWAESDGEGKGSRFIVELPVEMPKEILEKLKTQ